MAQPTIDQVYVSAPLTNISVAYMNQPSNFIAGRVFPVVPVDTPEGIFFVYNKGDWFRDEVEPRVDEEESAGSGYRIAQDTFRTEIYAFHKDIPRRVRLAAVPATNPDVAASRFVTQRFLTFQEVHWVSTYFAAGVWDTDVTGVAASPGVGEFVQWSNYTTSTPTDDIDNAKDAISGVTGIEPNTLVLGSNVYRKLRNHPELVDRFKYTDPSNITEQMLATYLEIERVFISRAIVNTAQEGATESYSRIMGNHAWLGYVTPAPSLLEPSAGYNFTWAGINPSMGENINMKRLDFASIGREVVRVEGEMAWDMKVVATDLGYFFEDAVA